MASSYLSPGVYVEEVDRGSKPIEAVGTNTVGFLGTCAKGPVNKPIFVGEFGVPGESPEQAATFRRLLTMIVDHEIPLAALWVFDYSRQEDYNVTATNARAWQLDSIADLNRKLRNGG